MVSIPSAGLHVDAMKQWYNLSTSDKPQITLKEKANG
jgi:hypothetical protein